MKKLTIYECSEQYRVPVSKLRRLEKDGFISFAPAVREGGDDILFALKKANPLSAGQLRQLLIQPELLNNLGKYKKLALIQLKMLGEPRQAKPLDHAATVITSAAMNDPETTRALAQWIAETIPADGCTYHYLAVRALLCVADNVFDIVYQSVNRAFTNARKMPELDGMSETIAKRTQFFPKREMIFDL